MLVLSLFPGMGLLDLAFEEAGYAVVRGPDRIWGGDIKGFHVPPGRFDGVIGGPPCQKFGGLANFSGRWKVKPENLIPEFERVVDEARPGWFLMENVRNAPLPAVEGYEVRDVLLNNRWLGEEQSRLRRFSFGTPDGRPLRIETEVFEPQVFAQTVTSAHGGERRVHGKKATGGKITRYTVPEALRLQGLSPDFFGPKSPFIERAKLKALAEGVPLPMGRAVARAVRESLAVPLNGGGGES